jgi:UPF0716 protein FxsA
MPLSILPFLFLAVPVMEITVFILVGSQIGVLPTILLVLLTAAAGATLLRIQGFGVLSRIRAQMDAGMLPGRELGNGAMILAAGVLLLTPGFVTDTIGLLLFVPQVRDRIWRFISSRVTVVTNFGPGGRRPGGPPSDGGSDGVVDLDPEEFTVRDGGGAKSPESPWIGPKP